VKTLTELKLDPKVGGEKSRERKRNEKTNNNKTTLFGELIEKLMRNVASRTEFQFRFTPK